MGSNLQNAVCGGINDQITGAQVFLTIITNDLCAGVRQIAEDAETGFLRKTVQHFFGKSIWIGWHRFLGDKSHQFPVTGCGILTSGTLCHSAISGSRLFHRLSNRDPIDLVQPHFLHIGNLELSGSKAGSQGIAAAILIICGIREFPDAKAVKNNDKNTFHKGTS